jgi:hypothetical protein
VQLSKQNLKLMNIKTALMIFLVGLLITACSTLTSTTSIDANNSFVLGNNPHGTFSVRLKNISEEDIELHRAPIDGGRHSFETVKPGETIKVNVDKNTALVIDNKSTKKASVELFVTGDTGLSMGYKD